jgi:tetratricopeptide (TPR) repeat protein
MQPTLAVDHFLLGDDFRRQGKMEEAIMAFDSALRADSGHFWARYFLAVCFLPNEARAAKALLTACIRERPEFVWSYYLRGTAHGQLSQFEAAIDDFDRALRLCPADLPQADELHYAVLVNRAALNRRQGWFADAKTDLDQAIRLQPDRYQAYWNLASLLETIRKADEAMAQLDRACAVAQLSDKEGGAEAATLALLYHHRARLNFARQKWTAAAQDVEKSIQLRPYAESHVLRARLWERKGEQKKAAVACQQALQVSAANAKEYIRARTYSQLARALLECQDYPQAIATLDRCLQEGGQGDAMIYRLRGLARAKSAKYGGAISDYTQALALEPNDSFTHAYRGWVYLVQDALKPALADFEEAIRLDPKNGDAYSGRGYVRVRRADSAGAVSDAEEALTQGPETNRIVWNVSRIYAYAVQVNDVRQRRSVDELKIRKKYQDRSVQLLRRALDLTPSSERASFWRSYVRPDVEGAFASLRSTPDFIVLETEFGPEKSAP